MLKYALTAITAALVLAVVFVLLPIHSGPRPEPRLLASGEALPATNFTIRDAPPPPAAPATAPAAAPSPGDLDAVMQRLRATSARPDASAAAPPPAAVPAPTAVSAPTPAPTPAPDPAASPPPPNRWGSVTGQGTRWRLAKAGNGYTVSIDLGGGKVADVHVLSAFANLDPAAVNVRVDYLRDTILQNFPGQSGTYSFARDGSVSMER